MSNGFCVFHHFYAKAALRFRQNCMLSRNFLEFKFFSFLFQFFHRLKSFLAIFQKLSVQRTLMCFPIFPGHTYRRFRWIMKYLPAPPNALQESAASLPPGKFSQNAKRGLLQNLRFATVPFTDWQKSFAEFFAEEKNKVKKHFWPRRVRGQKYLSGCKCGICSLMTNIFCTQQTAKNWRKAPKGFFDTLQWALPFRQCPFRNFISAVCSCRACTSPLLPDGFWQHFLHF